MKNPSLTAWAKAQGFDSEDFESDVQERMADKATAINDDGMDGQLEFLSQELGGEEGEKKYLRTMFCISKDAEVSEEANA